MARSHVCTGCGTELASLRAPPDPRYALRVVVCPSCARPSVRTRASVELAWRRARRTGRSWLALIAQGALLACLLTAVGVPYLQLEALVLGEWRMSWTAAARAVASGTLGEAARNPDALREVAVWAGMFVASSVVSGVWLRAGLAHWRRAPAHLFWFLALALALLVPPAVAGVRHALVDGAPPPIGVEPAERLGRLGAGVLSAAIAAAGAPLGRVLERAARAGRARQLARRRRKLRALWRPTA